MKKRYWTIFISFLLFFFVLLIFLLFFSFDFDKGCGEFPKGSLRQDCENCSNEENEQYCLDFVYSDLAVIKGEASICNKVSQQYAVERCLKRVDISLSRRRA